MKAVEGRRGRTFMSEEARKVSTVIERAPVSADAKASALQAYYAAISPEDFRTRFDFMALPQETKRELWNLRCANTQPCCLQAVANGTSRAVFP